MQKLTRSRRWTLTTVALLLGWTAGCDRGDGEASVATLSGRTMGTSYSVKLTPYPGERRLAALAERVAAVLARVDARMSTYRDGSEVTRFGRSASTDWFPVSAETAGVVREALRIGSLTSGALDVTVAPLVDLWGFGPPDERDRPPTDEEIARALTTTGLTRLAVRPAGETPAALRKTNAATRIDLSSIAKGHAVDAVADVLAADGVENFLIEVGGEMRVAGAKGPGSPWTIGIERPVRGPQREIERKVQLRNVALATSGDYRNFRVVDGRYYSHTIDPRTGRPVTHGLASVTIIAGTCAEADGLATALMVLGPDRGYTLAVEQGLAALFIVRKDAGSVRPDSPAELVERATPAMAAILAPPTE